MSDIAEGCFGARAADASPDTLRGILGRAALSTAAHRNPGIDDLPLLLSSGLDSNALASVYAGRDRAVSAVTVSYPEADTPQDESALAEAAARHYGMALRKVAVRADRDLLERALHHLEAPTYSSSAIALLTIARHLSTRGVKVALVGDGSDELFFGYSQLLHAPDALPEAYQARIGLADTATVAALTGEPKSALDLRVRDALGAEAGVETWRAYQAFELRYRIPDYQAHRLDRLFMAHGIEARVPFLRREVVDWALSVGRGAHVAGGRKSLLASAVAGGIAPAVRGLAKKRFVAPVARWRGEGLGRDMHAHVGRDALLRLGFRPTLSSRAFAGLSDRCAWGLYMMSLWADHNWQLERSA